MLIAETDLNRVQRLRADIEDGATDSLEKSATAFATALVASFESVVLCRVFAVLELSALPAAERDWATVFAHGKGKLESTTRVLSLLGTKGREPAWNERVKSRGHRAIPLLDASFVRGAPMIAKLLADMEVDLSVLDTGAPIATRRMLGGTNVTFYVPDATEARDAFDRRIIGDKAFVERYGVRTVFGMGGAYVSGELVTAIVFTTEKLERPMVDRFPSLIGSFKIKTAPLVQKGRIFA